MGNAVYVLHYVNSTIDPPVSKHVKNSKYHSVWKLPLQYQQKKTCAGEEFPTSPTHASPTTQRHTAENRQTITKHNKDIENLLDKSFKSYQKMKWRERYLGYLATQPFTTGCIKKSIGSRTGNWHWILQILLFLYSDIVSCNAKFAMQRWSYLSCLCVLEQHFNIQALITSTN